MYKKKQPRQYTFQDFDQAFGFPIDPENRWVKLEGQIPWDEVEEIYAKAFASDVGNLAVSARMAFGALVIRRVFGESDRGTVKLIQESPYLQHFLGLPRYEHAQPFDPSLMVRFRERLDLDKLGDITDKIVEFQKKTVAGAKGRAPEDGGVPTSAGKNGAYSEEAAEEAISRAAEAMAEEITSGRPGKGTLIIDATCSPVHIRYPQDASLLNEAREKLERILDRVCRDSGEKKPRTYRRVAHKEYLAFAKMKKRPAKKLRHILRILLNCVERNLRHLDGFLEKGLKLKPREEGMVQTIRTLYGQQKQMFDKKEHRVDDRIVSIHMPFVRPIVRGKVPVPTEFGPKYDISVDGEGNSRIEFFSYDAYNESTHFQEAVEAYRKRAGAYPEKVLVDTIYRTRANRDYCKEHGIRISGPKLGRRPKADPDQTKAQKATERQDLVDRIEVERRFARTKWCFGLDLVMEKREDTVGSSIALGILLDNLIPAGF